MFSQHVTKLLSVYCHNELTTAEMPRVAAHLQQCAACRKEYETIKLGLAFAQQLVVTPAPDSLWPALAAKLAAPPQPYTSWQLWGWVGAAAAALLLLFGGWYGWQRNHKTTLVRGPNSVASPTPGPRLPDITAAQTPSTAVSRSPTSSIHLIPALKPTPQTGIPAWEVARLTGAPQIGTAQIQNQGRLAVGEWLETDNASSAQIKVAEIGFVEIAPNSRVGLVRTKETEHRISLAKGKMSAFILAPPRLFVVDTPSATAVDLGCAYTLEVDDYGGSLLQVTSGWVSLLLQGREAVIPAGAMCMTRKGIGVGTPYFADASEAFKTALTKLDFGRNGLPQEQLSVVLAESRPQDSLTLWHLLSRQYSAQTTELRGRVFDRLAELAPPPADVTRGGIVKGDRRMLDRWWEEKIR